MFEHNPYLYKIPINGVYDFKLGIKTKKIIEVTDLKIFHKDIQNARKYQPTPYPIIKKVFELINIPIESLKLFDIGCGLGRTLFFAASIGAPVVGGIDLSQETNELLLKNLARFQKKFPANKTSFQTFFGNAKDFEFYQDYNVFFLFNPFDQYILSPVLDNILASVKNDFYIVSVNSIRRSIFLQKKLQLIHHYQQANFNYSIQIYSPY